MDISEWGKIAKAIKAYYPREAVLPNEEAVLLWYDALSDLDYNVVMVALKKWAMTQKFSPQISDLRSISASVANERIPDWDEAWADVTKAISYYGYYRQDEALEMMDELTLKAVKTLGYRELCMSENPMADRAQFQRVYENLAKRKREDEQISPTIRAMIDRLQEQSLLDDKTNIKLIEGEE